MQRQNAGFVFFYGIGNRYSLVEVKKTERKQNISCAIIVCVEKANF